MKLLELRWPAVVLGVVLVVALAGLVESAVPLDAEPLTQGYWKTHSEYGPAPYDDTWASLADGADTLFLDTGKSYYEVLWTKPKKGNAYYILAHQYIAAVLNQLNGADSGEVDDAINHAKDLLDEYDGSPSPMSDIIGGFREDFIGTAETLDEWNNSGDD